MKILSIDDSKAILSFVKEVFEGTSHEVEIATGGEEGISMVDTKGHSYYDLILLDWEMPVVDGPQVLKSIKEKGVSTPVIMLTSRNAEEDIVKMLELGAAEFIMKPFTKDLIFNKIEQVLGRSLNE